METSSEDRIELLKGYLKRLKEGESLESVQADFVKNFKSVEAVEIMKAEQALVKEGAPISELKNLCDIHSAMFHGATKEEKIANAEKEVSASAKREQDQVQGQQFSSAVGAVRPDPMREKMERTQQLIRTVGHPLAVLTKENQVIQDLIGLAQKQLETGEDPTGTVFKLRFLSVHYAKKGDLLYPQLKEKYNITGPSDVMWTVDDEIRDDISSLNKKTDHDEKWNSDLKAVLKRAGEMVYKEANILFPVAAMYFTKEDWYGVYRDSKDFPEIFGVKQTKWPEAEEALQKQRSEAAAGTKLLQGEVVMPGGHLTVEQLTAMLNTLPLEISFVDDQDINRYFNEGPKVFKRPHSAIDRSVFACHSPRAEMMARSIIDDFRKGRLDSVPVWMEKNGLPMLVTYMAVRDKEGNYLGTVEVVQNMEEAKRHFQV
ncbi:MAG TPA: histidine kinase [Lachnospiraceae bacterium]|nr:histidine kinase [Lachnospiraceae bacterium]